MRKQSRRHEPGRLSALTGQSNQLLTGSTVARRVHRIIRIEDAVQLNRHAGDGQLDVYGGDPRHVDRLHWVITADYYGPA